MAYASVSIALTYPALYIPFRLIGLRVSQLWRLLLPTLLATVPMAACTLLVRYLVADSLPPAWHLAVAVLTGAMVYVAACLLWNRQRILEIRDLLLGRTSAAAAEAAATTSEH